MKSLQSTYLYVYLEAEVYLHQQEHNNIKLK
jgi:hypothetical protein